MHLSYQKGRSTFTEFETQVEETVRLEFHICVTLVGENEYLLRTEKVVPGVHLAQEKAILPLEDWLSQAEQLLSREQTKLDNSLNLVLGKQLYHAVFQGTLRESWSQAQAIAQKQQEVLRLRLGITGRLAELPWEIMHTGDRYLITDPCITFSRYRADIKSRLNQDITVPESAGLKVLMATAVPTDQTNLTLEPLVDLQFTILNQPEPQQLTLALQGGYQILHYVGHRLYLVIRKTGSSVTLNQGELAELFVKDEVQMAVLNSTDAFDRCGNLTQSLLQRGIECVLTVETPLSDRISLTLTQLFYRYLSQGYPVDLSLSCARLGLISAYGADDLSWALPILYLQPEFDGYLEAAAVDLLEEWNEFDEEEDIFYEQDAALVSELFCQLAAPPACASPSELIPIAPQATKNDLGGCEQPPIKSFIAWIVSGVVGMSAIALLVALCFSWKPASRTFSIPAESVWHQIKDGYFLKHPSDRH